MTVRQDLAALQRRLGVPADGLIGPLTIAAMKLALDERDSLKAAGRPPSAGGLSAAANAAAPASEPPAQPQGQKTGGLKLSDKGAALIHSFEQCRLTAYPDPGSANGEPWTIGWGATGPGIRRGTVWTQQQADERFRQDIASREERLNDILVGTPTTQAQFDALLSLGYNIGMDALAGSTVMRKHKAGDYEGAVKAFASWRFNDGKEMRGLVRRRAAEAEHYRGRA